MPLVARAIVPMRGRKPPCEQPRGPARDCESVVYTLLATTM
jgi:hypothetical protein